MKKIFAIVITFAMLLSLAAVVASAEVPNVPWTPGNFAVADSADFTPVGEVKITWDADAGKKLGGKITFVDAIHYIKGEGIEKKVDDFAAEVAAQVAGAHK